jgi:hypothetical protein
MVFITSRLDPEDSFIGLSEVASVIVCVGLSYAALKLIDETIWRWLTHRASQRKSESGILSASQTPS